MLDASANVWDQGPHGSFLAALGLQDLLETMPDLGFVCDPRGTLLWASPAFESLTGQPLSEWVGRPLLPHLSPAARRRALRALARQRRRDEPGFEVVLPVTDERGNESSVTVRAQRSRRSDGQVFVAGTAQPTRTRAAGEPVAGDRAGAGSHEPARPDPAGGGEKGVEPETLPASEVLATVNREIRAPMNALIGMARLLLQTELSDEQQALADLIWKSGQSALRLVNDACVFTRPEAGQLDLDLIPFDLRVTVDETAVSLASLAADRGLELQCRVHPAVPSRLRGDPGRLRQILMNLGERAMQTPACLRAEVLVSRLRETEQSVTLRFLVLGRSATPGGPEAVKADSPARPGGEPGAVWGLAVIQRLADLMGGRTGTETTDGEGSRYWFDVELQKQEELEPTAVPFPSKMELATKRALIVDTSPVAVRTLQARLARVGCRVCEAHDAEEALTALRAAVESGDPFHFVLIDRDLPGVDGEELGAMIRADHALDVARTVVLTTVGRRGDAARAHARGFSAFLPKAMAVEELVDALCEVIHQAMVTPPGGRPELVTRYSLAEGRRSKTCVLLVDEDAVNQVVTQWYLRRLGYRLQIASTIAEARSAWSGGRFDIVMVDEQLADGDALALARELRGGEGESRNAAFVAMFRQEESPARLSWQDSGMGDAITKPVDLVVLARLLERLTGTGLPAGCGVEDDNAGMPAVGSELLPADRLEIVTPDVERILTESEMHAAMASAMRFAVAAPAAEAPDPDPVLAWPETAAVVEPAPVPADWAVPGEPDPSPAPALVTLQPEDVQVLEAPPWPAAEPEPASPSPAAAWPDEAVLEGPAPDVPGDEVRADGLPDASVETLPDAPVETLPDALAETLPDALAETLPDALAEAAWAEEPVAGLPEVGTTGLVPPVAPEETEQADPASDRPREPVRLELVETQPPPPKAAPEPVAGFDLDRLESASMGLPSLRQALLSTFMNEINPFLEKLSWMLSDEDAQLAATEAHGLAVLSRSIGAVACAEALEELERRHAEGTLKATDAILQRCHGQGLNAASEVRALLGQQRRAA